jgi:cell shape-determining protein MreC
VPEVSISDLKAENEALRSQVATLIEANGKLLDVNAENVALSRSAAC